MHGINLAVRTHTSIWILNFNANIASIFFSFAKKVCDYCDPTREDRAHPAEYAIDGTSNWWQSPPLSRGMKYNEVNLTIDFGQVSIPRVLNALREKINASTDSRVYAKMIWFWFRLKWNALIFLSHHRFEMVWKAEITSRIHFPFLKYRSFLVCLNFSMVLLQLRSDRCSFSCLCSVLGEEESDNRSCHDHKCIFGVCLCI